MARPVMTPNKGVITGRPDAHRRIRLDPGRICCPVASGSEGPPQARRKSAWITPCGWPVR